MSWPATLRLAGVLALGIAALPSPVASEELPSADAAQSPSLDGVIGVNLTAIDGSTIALTASEGGMAREIVGPNGRTQRTFFSFINDKLGTVANVADLNKTVGVFRASATGLEISFADGTSETMSAIPGGGISLVTKAGESEACVAWYPAGHAFSLEERKAALAQYASKLGLPGADDVKLVPSKVGCSVVSPKPAPVAEAKPDPAKALTPKLAQSGAKPTTAFVAAVAKSAAAKPGEALPDTKPVDVRDSQVHPIDADLTKSEPAASAETNAPDAAAPDAKAADADVAKPAGEQVAALEPAANPATPPRAGASACLNVESDGSHWGFRNRCDYTVQFAYCLMNDDQQLASCRDGAITGSVTGKGFGALIADRSLSENDAMHQFRWVACQGGAGEVVPRLDQVMPPSGRCLRQGPMSGG